MSQEDAAALLSEFIYQIDNLPAEVAFLLDEIGWKDEKLQEARLRNLQRDALIQKHIKQHGLLSASPKEAPLLPKMRADQAKMVKLSDEKLALAERACRLLDKYVAELDADFQRLKDMGYQLGEAEAAQAAAQAQVAAASAAMPALDFSSSSNKKRLSGMGLPGNKNASFNTSVGGMPSPGIQSASIHNFPNNPYAANSNPFQGTNLQNTTYQTMQAGMNSAMFANIGQFNANAMPLQQHQQQPIQQFQGQAGQYPQGQFQLQGAVPNMAANSQAARDASKPHRPSRLSTSFSATGAGPHTAILPTTAAAHMPHQAQGLAGTGQGGSGSNKRSRPLQANLAGRNKKKKRIVETDDESAADDASGQAEASEDVDAEGEEEDAEGEDDRGVLSFPASQQVKRLGSQKIASRAGTPSGGNKGGQNKAGAAARKLGKKQEEEEDAEADAEGEEDWAQEVDETNADDPTLYCFCHRVSYGNMIACDNPDCKYEWFHWACVRVTKQPDDDQKWYCPECRPKMLGLTGNQATGQGMGKGNINFQGGRVLGSGASGPYQQLQAEQQQMMMAAQQAREGSTGRSSRRG